IIPLWGFTKALVGQALIQSSYRQLTYVDTLYHASSEEVRTICKRNKIDFVTIIGNDITIELPPMDLLFIDTWHVYGHLKRELERHQSKVRKYIIMHDTTVDEWLGETI